MKFVTRYPVSFLQGVCLSFGTFPHEVVFNISCDFQAVLTRFHFREILFVWNLGTKISLHLKSAQMTSDSTENFRVVFWGPEESRNKFWSKSVTSKFCCTYQPMPLVQLVRNGLLKREFGNPGGRPQFAWREKFARLSCLLIRFDFCLRFSTFWNFRLIIKTFLRGWIL